MKNHVVILSCVFPPELVVSSKTSAEIAGGLAERGNDVTVVTSFPCRPGGKVFPGYQRKIISRSTSTDGGGYDIVRCFSVPSGESSAFSRLVENLVFGVSAAVYLAFSPRPDVLYSNTWPIFASGLMSLVASIRRIPYVLSIQDVYPESFVSQGRSGKNSLVSRIMRAIDRQVSVRAAHIIAISEPICRIYVEDRGIPPERISVVPNWAVDDPLPVDGSASASLRARFGIPASAFLVAYGGNIGMAAGTETLVQACQHTPDVYALIAGEGSQLSICQEMAKAHEHISFLTPWSPELTMPFYRAANVLVLTTRGEQSLASAPSKLIRYMLSGRPIIAMGLPGSDLAHVIQESGCGWLVAPDRPDLLAEKIVEVKALDAAELERRGAAGRQYALDHFTNTACLPTALAILERFSRGENGSGRLVTDNN